MICRRTEIFMAGKFEVNWTFPRTGLVKIWRRLTCLVYGFIEAQLLSAGSSLLVVIGIRAGCPASAETLEDQLKCELSGRMASHKKHPRSAVFASFWDAKYRIEPDTSFCGRATPGMAVST